MWRILETSGNCSLSLLSVSSSRKAETHIRAANAARTQEVQIDETATS